MTMKPMYPAIVNSPGTEITADISASDTAITVASAASLPPAPNLMTIGNDETAETVRYTEVNKNTLTVERGFQSEAKSWSAGTKVARYFTAYDHNVFRENIEDHETRIETHVADEVRHVTAEKQASWNAKETPEGAQAKANQAEANAKSHADTKATQAEINAKNHANVLVGDLNQLQTANKGNVVLAVNEVFQSGVNAKQGIVDAINALGGNASTNDSWEVLSQKIRAISTGISNAYMVLNREYYKPEMVDPILRFDWAEGYKNTQDVAVTVNPTVGYIGMRARYMSDTAIIQAVTRQPVNLTNVGYLEMEFYTKYSLESGVRIQLGVMANYNVSGVFYDRYKQVNYSAMSEKERLKILLDVRDLSGTFYVGIDVQNPNSSRVVDIEVNAVRLLQGL